MIFNNRDEVHNEIVIIGKGRKERLIFLNHSCQKALLTFLKYKFHTENISKIRSINEFLFSEENLSKKPISRHKIYYLLRNIASQCGIDPFRISPHVLRHSVAIHMLMNKNNDSPNNIMTIKKFLGHESIDTTKIYLDYDNINDLAKTINTKHPLSFL
jgi:integrase/recombinase XerD